MSNLLTSIAAISATRVAGNVIQKSAQAIRSAGDSALFAEVFAADSPSSVAEQSPSDPATFLDRLRDWLSELGIDKNASLEFSIDAGGQPKLAQPPGHAAAADFRLSEHPGLKAELVERLRAQPGGSLRIASKDGIGLT